MKKILREIVLSFILPSITSFLIFLVSPPNSLTLLHFFAFLPLFFSLTLNQRWKNLIKGYICGYLANILIFYWIPETIANYSNLPLSLGITSLLLLSLYISLPYAIISFVFPYVIQKFKIYSIYLIPIIYGTIEYYFPQIFPYQQGDSLFFIPPLAQVFSIGGTTIASFLIIHVNTLLYWTIKEYLKRRRVIFIPLVTTSIFFSAILMWGSMRIERIERMMDRSEKVKVGIVQPNIEIEDRKLQSRGDMWRRLSRLTNLLVEDGVSFVVWPEGASPFSPQSPKGRGFLEGLSKSKGLEIVTGGGRSERIGDEILEYNSAFFITPDEGVSGYYDKIKLLAFGEYLPFSDIFPVLKDWIKGGGDFERGKIYKVFEGGSFSFSVLICYEAIIPRFVRRFVQEGAEVFINITNDAWFGRTPAPYQHLMLASIRCIEYGLPMIRCANTGVSAIVLPDGRTPVMTDIYKEEVRSYLLPHSKIETFYMRFPFIFPSIFTFVTFFTTILIVKKR